MSRPSQSEPDAKESVDGSTPAAFFGPVSSLGTPHPTYMLDTNICIYILKKNRQVLDRFRSHLPGGICISAIVLAELSFGVAHSKFVEQNYTALRNFINLVQILPFDYTATYDYGKIRNYLQAQGTPIGSLDTLIAAHAYSQNLILVTNNLKEFSRIPGLKLENWAA